MFTITLKRSVAALAVTAGLLATAGPASAARTGVVDGTSNTLQVGLVAKP